MITCQWALLESSVPVCGVSEYIYITSFKVRVCVHRQPTPAVSWRILCAGIHLGITWKRKRSMRRATRWWRGHSVPGWRSQATCGWRLGRLPGSHLHGAKKDFSMTPRRPRRSEAGRSFCHMRVLSVFTQWITKCFHECFCWFSGSACTMGPFGSCLLEKSV